MASPTFTNLHKSRHQPTLDQEAARDQALVDYLGVPGHAALTNAAKTITWGVSKNVQVLAVAITADRALTLATTGAVEGARFRVLRTAAATGAFALNVGTGPLKALAPGDWVEVGYSGSAWLVTAAGSL